MNTIYLHFWRAFHWYQIHSTLISQKMALHKENSISQLPNWWAAPNRQKESQLAMCELATGLREHRMRVGCHIPCIHHPDRHKNMDGEAQGTTIGLHRRLGLQTTFFHRNSTYLYTKAKQFYWPKAVGISYQLGAYRFIGALFVRQPTEAQHIVRLVIWNSHTAEVICTG